jgi:hypothetical protein
VATARLFLAQMARQQGTAWPAALTAGAIPPLAAWLYEQGLGPLAYHTYRRLDGSAAELARCLRHDYYCAAAEATLRQTLLAEILNLFQQAALPVALLKGAALQPLYGHAGLRTMSDLDFWLPASRMAEAVTLLQGAGYYVQTKEDRPLALQQLSLGEIQLYKQGRTGWLAELHWSPFAGWWLQRTAAIDHDLLWSRIAAIPEPELAQIAPPADLPAPVSAQAPPSPPASGREEPPVGRQPVCELAPEDAVIHLAVHLAVNHQFAPPVVRGLMDIVLTAQARGVDWAVVAARARAWRVATAVWLALRLAEQLLGLEGAGEALRLLRPTSFRRRLLRRFVSVPSVLAGRDLCHGRRRFLLLLLLVDRPQDAGKLLLRAVWPEKEWLAARYGRNAGRLRHLWGIVGRGQV